MPNVTNTTAGNVVIELKLSGDAVVAPVYRATRDSLEVLGIALPAIERADVTQLAPIPGSIINFSVRGTDPIDAQERRLTYTNWLLGKAFQELVRALNEALQEAYFYTEVLALPEGETTLGELQDAIDAIRQRGNKMNFAQLLQNVGARLKTTLQFADEYQSLQNVRNCLEHRAGVVGEKDTDSSGRLTLRIPTFELIIKKPDGSIIVMDNQDGIVLEGGGTVAMRFFTMEKVYLVGERVTLSPAEFQRIAQGCTRFCEDLGSKLPLKTIAVPAPAESTPSP